MTLLEIVDRLNLGLGAINRINQFIGEVDTAIVAEDATFEPFLTPERVATMAIAAPKKAKKDG